MQHLEQLLAFFALVGQEVLHDPIFHWSPEHEDAQMVTIEQGQGYARFVFDRDGNFIETWIEAK